MPGLTTHVLDTASGHPAGGVAITLFEIVGNERREIASAVTNDDGRTDQALMDTVRQGHFEIVFGIGAYFASRGTTPGFLDQVPVRFHITDMSRHWHVPLLASPWGYTTYRGS